MFVRVLDKFPSEQDCSRPGMSQVVSDNTAQVVSGNDLPWWMSDLGHDFGFPVSGFAFRVSRFRFQVSCFGFRVSCFRLRVSGLAKIVPEPEAQNLSILALATKVPVCVA